MLLHEVDLLSLVGRLVGCNDDACALKSEVSFFATAGTTYYIRAAGFGGAVGTMDVEITVDGGFGLVGTAEATPGANALGLVPRLLWWAAPTSWANPLPT